MDAGKGSGVNPALAKKVNEQRGAHKQVPATEVTEQTPPEQPQDMTTLAARFKVPTEKLAPVTDEHGNQTSEMEIFVAPKSKKTDIEALGGVLVHADQVVSDEGLDTDGRLEVTSVPGTGNPDTTYVVEPFEVDKKALEVDPKTGLAPVESMTAALLAEGEDILRVGNIQVPKDSVVAPAGYEFQMGTSAEGANTEKWKKRIGKFGDVASSLGQSGLVGLLPIPGSNLLAFAGSALSDSSKADALKQAQDTLGYLKQRQKTSETDKVTLEVGVGQEITVSGQAHEARLETMVRQAQGKLISNRILMGAGASSVIGIMASAGTFGSGAGAALLGTAATAAAPYLAGAAMVAGTGGMVFDSVDKLRKLSKEKAELQTMLDAGQTHVERAVEKQTAQGLQVNEVEVPIGERLEQIGKESRKHRLMATAVSGGAISIGATVIAGGGLAMAPLALGPAALVAGGHSIGQLKKLSGERKELMALKESGQTMVKRDVENFDGSWKTERVPISNLMAEVERKQKTQGMILTATASVTGALGLTLAGGLSVAAAAPLVLIPAALGAVLFPDKVKEFAGKVAGFLTGFASEESRTRKAMVKQTQERTGQFHEAMGKIMSPLYDDPKTKHLFNEFPQQGMLSKMRGQEPEGPPAGYFTVISAMVNDYANKGSREARAQAMAEIKEALAQAPPEAQSAMPALTRQIEALHMDTEAAWVARDIALELKTPMTEKVVGDSRVAARLGELGYDSKEIKPQYEGVLHLENDPKAFEKAMLRHQSGDKEATRQLSRQQVFASARAVHAMEKEVGQQLFTRVVDAIYRPDDAENMELVTKEVSYALRDPGNLLRGPDRDAYLSEPNLEYVGQRIGEVANALSILNTPVTMVPDTQEDLNNTAHRALQAMAGVDQKSALEMAKLHAATNNPDTFKGLDSKSREGKLGEMKQRFDELKTSFPDPEMVDYWLDCEARARKGPDAPTGGETQKQLDQKRAQTLDALANIDSAAAKKLDELEAKISAGFSGMSAPDALAERTKLGNQYNLLKGQFMRVNPDAFKAYEVATQKAKAGPPAQIAQEDAVSKEPLQGPTARMANAYRALHEISPKHAKALDKAFAQRFDPQELEGLSDTDAIRKKKELSDNLVGAVEKMRNKAPEMTALWEAAKNDLDEEFFERQIDRQFLGRVLEHSTVKAAQEKLELGAEDTEAILMGIRRAAVLGKPQALTDALVDETGKKMDPRKEEMHGVLDRALILTTGEVTKGGAEPASQTSETPKNPLDDPKIVAFLENNPVVHQVLTSEHLVALAQKMKINPEEAQMEFLKLQQVDMDPIATAEFQGRLEGGDVSAVRTLEIGRAVGGLINQLTRPDPEVVEAQLDAQMAGPGVKVILGDEQINKVAQELGVDLNGTLRKLIKADLSGDPSYVQSLQANANKGVTAARNEFQMVQILAQAIAHVNQQAMQVQAQAEAAAAAEAGGGDPKAA